MVFVPITGYRLSITRLGVFFFLCIAFLFTFYAAVADAALVVCGPTDPSQVAAANNVSGCRLRDIFNLLVNIYNFLLGLAAIVGMVVIIASGILMLIYHWFENPESVLAGAKYTLTRAILGLVIVIVAYVLVFTLLRILGLSDQTILEYFQGAAFGA